LRKSNGDRVSSTEVYKLNCLQCCHTAEVPVGAPNELQGHNCCQRRVGLLRDWRGSEPPRAA
jgi:hypothetical protein